jgi:glutamine amidotransferase
MTTIVDYGVGNVQAICNVYKRLNIPVAFGKTPDDLRAATKLILPGVGAFDNAMVRLNESGMRATLDELVLEKKVPVVGICVGMQMLTQASDEGQLPGLGWIPGRVRAFQGHNIPGLMVPHLGWNDVAPVPGARLFTQLETGARFYFLHSYYVECERAEDVAARCSYGLDFACAVGHDNILGVQFHPEKSHHFGTRLLQNFAELA